MNKANMHYRQVYRTTFQQLVNIVSERSPIRSDRAVYYCKIFFRRIYAINKLINEKNKQSAVLNVSFVCAQIKGTLHKSMTTGKRFFVLLQLIKPIEIL